MTNKMTEAELHAELDGVKEGDVVRAVFEGRLSEPNRPTICFDTSKGISPLVIRYSIGDLQKHLISVENLGQPEPPEPEVGSFALADGKVIQRLTIKSGDCWYHPDGSRILTWDKIKDVIKVLYNPDGSINEGWKR